MGSRRDRRQRQWSNTVNEGRAYDKVRQRGGSRAEANRVADKVRQANERGQKGKGCAVTAVAVGLGLASAIAAWRGWA